MIRHLSAFCLLLVLAGCGKTVNHSATEQLVLSDASEKALRSIDFSPLAGRDCYIDQTYIPVIKAPHYASSEFVISSMRNQILAAGCRLVKTAAEAEIIVEPRIGTLGTDGHEVSYGVPSNNLLSQAAAAMPATPPVPTIPEISLARRDDNVAIVKIAVFAYEARTGLPVWQSGTSIARSHARDSYLFGVGPIQGGAVYQKPRFAGRRVRLPLIGDEDGDRRRQAVSLDEEFVFYEEPAQTESLTASQEPQQAPPAEGEIQQTAGEVPAQSSK